MIGLSQHHRYYLREDPTDMRKSFDGRSVLILTECSMDPMDGSPGALCCITRGWNRVHLTCLPGIGGITESQY